MSKDQEFDEWREIIKTTEALINLVDPNGKKIRLSILVFGLIVIEHKQSKATMRITNIKTAIKDITYFVNNDPALCFAKGISPNENVVSNKH